MAKERLTISQCGTIIKTTAVSITFYRYGFSHQHALMHHPIV